MILLLNGTSSSGKTSLAKSLQSILEPPFLHAGIDHIIFMLPKRYLHPPLWHDIFEYHYPSGELEIYAGALGQRLVSGLHHSVAALAGQGWNVVMDHVLLDPAWLAECVDLFSPYTVWFVGVRCPLDVVEQRERQRGDRTLGQARAQYAAVHAHGPYDIEVDTSLFSPGECAGQIRSRVDSGRAPQAFSRLRSSLVK